MKKNTAIFRYLLTSIILASMMTACSTPEQQKTVGVILANTASAAQLSGASIAPEQEIGYTLSGEADSNELALKYGYESVQQDENQVMVRGLVEDKDQLVVALTGATSNESTLRVAALSNFFNVPMVVPSAVGDNVLPENNLWAFRLSAPGSAHASYLFGAGLITRQKITELTLSQDFPKPLKLAIIYERNTFGDSSAVATAKAAMAQDVEIALYTSFDPDNPDKTSLDQIVNSTKDAKVHLIYLISNNPGVAKQIVSRLEQGINADERPVLLGQSGAFASKTFLESPEAEGMFILRQQIVPDQCPDEVTTLAEAQSFGAIYLLNFAISQAQDDLPNDSTLEQMRETVRDKLKQVSINVRCLGPVSFDNSGQNKNLQFELLQVNSGAANLVSSQTLIDALDKVLNYDPFDN